MKKVAYLPLLLVLASAGLAFGENPQAGNVGKLLEELNSLKASIAQEQKAQEGLAADKKLLDAQDKAIKSTEEQLKKDIPKWEQDVASWKTADAKFIAGKNAYIARYGCWEDCKTKVIYKLPEQKAAHDAQWAEVSSLNAELAKVNAEENRLKQREGELQKTWNLIKEGKATLSKATLEWAAKKKASNAKMDELVARYQALTKTYMDLAQRADMSEECKQIAYSNDRPVMVNGRMVGRQSGLDFAILNTAMERAHRCLQKVWDGAR